MTNEHTITGTAPAEVKPPEQKEQRHVPGRSAIVTLADRLGVETGELFLRSLRKVAFREDLLDAPVTHEQLMALVVVANQYKLNPFTREIYAFPDKKGGGIVPVVGVDGWLRIINEHEQMDGLEYVELTDEEGRYGECTIWRKDRSHPLKLREYLKEVTRGTDPWRQYSKRMLRHKTIIQAGRVAFGFSGIYEPDEAERIIEAREKPLSTSTMQQKGVDRLAVLLGQEKAAQSVSAVEQVISGQANPPPQPVDDDGARVRGAMAGAITDEDAEREAERQAIEQDRLRGGISGELPI